MCKRGLCTAVGILILFIAWHLVVQHSMDKFIAFRISDCNLILTILLTKQKLRIPKFVMPIKMDMINGASPF